MRPVQLALVCAYSSVGAAVATIGAYNVTLALAALFHRPPAATGARTRRLAVLVPAHDESELVARCVASLKAQTYSADLADVIVIADNCTDDTAERAAAAGAEVLVRDEPDARGKGQALRWAIERVSARTPAPDVVVVVDADSIAVPEFLDRIADTFERGAEAAQGESLLIDDGTPASTLRATAFLLVNRVRPAGRAVLGLPSSLGGNGMAFALDTLRAHPWDAFSATEDIEYAIKLRAAGVRPVFAAGAVVESPTAPTAEATAQQQLRWEGGKLHVARQQVPRLLADALRARDASRLDAALELAVPPLGLFTAAGVAGTAAGAAAYAVGAIPGWPVAVWASALASVPAYVLIGLPAARAPRAAYRALLQAPAFVVRKALRAHRLLSFRADSWVRTERAARDADPAA